MTSTQPETSQPAPVMDLDSDEEERGEKPNTITSGKFPSRLTVKECDVELKWYGDILAPTKLAGKRKRLVQLRKENDDCRRAKQSSGGPAPPGPACEAQQAGGAESEADSAPAPESGADSAPAPAAADSAPAPAKSRKWCNNEYIRLGHVCVDGRLGAAMGAAMHGDVGEGVDQSRNRFLQDDKNDDTNPNLHMSLAQLFNDPSFKPANTSDLQICSNLDPGHWYCTRDSATIKIKMRDIKRMNTLPFRAIFDDVSGDNEKRDITAIVNVKCSQVEAPLVAYFADLFDCQPIMDFMHKGLGEGGFEEYEEGDKADEWDDSGTSGSPKRSSSGTRRTSTSSTPVDGDFFFAVFIYCHRSKLRLQAVPVRAYWMSRGAGWAEQQRARAKGEKYGDLTGPRRQ